MDNITLSLMTGIDIPVPSCRLILHQPTVYEISLLGELNFFTGAQYLCVDKNSIAAQAKIDLSDQNNFQIFMTIMSQPDLKDKKDIVLQVLRLLFPGHNPIFTQQSIIITKEKDSFIIDENNFEDLQSIVRKVFCLYNGPEDQRGFNPANAEARAIAEKLMRGRERVAAQKGGTQSLYTQYLSILTIALNSMSLQDLMQLTPFQIGDLVERYGLYKNWDLDMKVRLAGGKPEGTVEDWMKNIH